MVKRMTRDPVLYLDMLSFRNNVDIPYPLAENNILLFGYARVALLEGLKTIGVKRGDNILLPDYICNTVMSPIHYLNIDVRFYHVEDDLAPNWDLIRDNIDEKTKALLVVNYFGFPNNLVIAQRLCKEYKIYLIEDNAHGFLSFDGKCPLGSYGDISIFSFRKTISLSNGAALIINNTELIKDKNSNIKYLSRRERTIRFILRLYFKRFQYLFNCYIGCHIYKAIKMTPADIMEEYNIEKYFTKYSILSKWVLRHLNTDIIIKQRRNMYIQWSNIIDYGFLPKAKPVFSQLSEGVVPYVFPIIVENQQRVMADMQKVGIECFPWPFLPKDSKESYLSKRMICLPVYPEINLERIFKYKIK